MKALAIVVLAAVTLPLVAAAQSPASVGERIRIRQTDGTSVVGTVVAASPLEMRIVGEGGELVVPTGNIRSLERSRGEGRSFAKNFFLAMGVTALVGGAIGGATYEPCDDTGFLACFLAPESRTDAVGFGLAAGAVVGIPIGILVGLGERGERWEGVPLPGGQALLSVIPRRDGFALRGSIPVGGFRR